MRASTISVALSTLALSWALPAPNSGSAPSSANIEYCESKGVVNALNCIKLLNDLHIDLGLLNKREPVPNGGGKTSQPSETTVNYCSSQGFLNLANCLDILNGASIDVDLLKGVLSERDDGWWDDGNWDEENWDDNNETPTQPTTTPCPSAKPSASPTPKPVQSSSTSPSVQPSPSDTPTWTDQPPTNEPSGEQPSGEEPSDEQPSGEEPSGGWTDADIKACKSKGFVNLLNCNEILNGLSVKLGILKKE
jgi:hypothetical protein